MSNIINGPEVVDGNPIIQTMLENQRRELRLEQLRLLAFLKGAATKWDPSEGKDPNLATGTISSRKEDAVSDKSKKKKHQDPRVSEGEAIEAGLLAGSKGVPSGRNAIFEAAGKIEELVETFENDMIKSLGREMVIAEAVIEALRRALQNMEEEDQHLATNFNLENHQNRQVVIDFIKQHQEALKRHLAKLEHLSHQNF